MSLHSIGYLFREGLKSLWKNRTMSVASIGVLIACLLMTGIAGLLSLNLSATMATVEGQQHHPSGPQPGCPLFGSRADR